MLTRVSFFLSTGRIELFQAPAVALFSGDSAVNRENCRGVSSHSETFPRIPLMRLKRLAHDVVIVFVLPGGQVFFEQG